MSPLEKTLLRLHLAASTDDEGERERAMAEAEKGEAVDKNAERSEQERPQQKATAHRTGSPGPGAWNHEPDTWQPFRFSFETQNPRDHPTSGGSAKKHAEAVGGDGGEYAAWACSLLNLLHRSDPQGAEDAASALAESLDAAGWAVALVPRLGRYVAEESEPDHDDFAERCPKGHSFTGANGKKYRGGMFIPGAVIAKAESDAAKGDPQAKAELEKLRSGKAAESARLEKRGQVDKGALAAKLKHDAPTPLEPWEQKQAAASARALLTHHGDLALHRIDELADAVRSAMDKTQDADVKARLGKRLAGLAHALEHAGEKGVTGERGVKDADRDSDSGRKDVGAGVGSGGAGGVEPTGAAADPQVAVAGTAEAPITPEIIRTMKAQMREGGQAKTPKDAAVDEWQAADHDEASLLKRISSPSLQMVKDTSGGKSELAELNRKLDKARKAKAKAEKVLNAADEAKGRAVTQADRAAAQKALVGYKPRNKYASGNVTLDNGTVLPALVGGGLAYGKTAGGSKAIMHAASGLIVSHAPDNRGAALAMMDRLREMTDWTKDAKTIQANIRPMETIEAINEVLDKAKADLAPEAPPPAPEAALPEVVTPPKPVDGPKLKEIKERAKARGVPVDPSITEDILDKVDHKIMLGHAINAKQMAKNARKLPTELRGGDVRFVPYRIGKPGETSYAPPTNARGFVEVPALDVIAHVDGMGVTQSDVDDVSGPRRLMWTAFRLKENRPTFTREEFGLPPEPTPPPADLAPEAPPPAPPPAVVAPPPPVAVKPPAEAKATPWHAERPEVFAAMRRIDAEVQWQWEQARQLGPRHGMISVGSADFDHTLKAQVGADYLNALRKGKTPEEALAEAQKNGREVVKNWNDKGSKGRATFTGGHEVKRWEGAADEIAMNFHRQMLRDTSPPPGHAATPVPTGGGPGLGLGRGALPDIGGPPKGPPDRMPPPTGGGGMGGSPHGGKFDAVLATAQDEVGKYGRNANIYPSDVAHHFASPAEAEAAMKDMRAEGMLQPSTTQRGAYNLVPPEGRAAAKEAHATSRRIAEQKAAREKEEAAERAKAEEARPSGGAGDRATIHGRPEHYSQRTGLKFVTSRDGRTVTVSGKTDRNEDVLRSTGFTFDHQKKAWTGPIGGVYDIDPVSHEMLTTGADHD